MGKEIGKIIIESVPNGIITGISLPIPQPCPRGIRQIVAEQIFVPGTDIRFYLPDEGVIKKVSAKEFEKVRQKSLDERRKFLDELMEEIQFADRLVIETTRR